METHAVKQRSKDSFRLRKTEGKTRVWEWSEEPRIIIRERINSSGGLGYRIVFPRSITGSEEIYLQSRDLAKAQELARGKGLEFRESRSTALVLSDAEKIQSASALSLLREYGITLPLDVLAREYVEAWSTLASHKVGVPEGAKALAEALKISTPTGKPLNVLLEYAAARVKPAGGEKTIAELAQEMIEIKKVWHARDDLRSVSLKDFRVRATRIAKDLGGFPLAEVTKDLLLKWLRELKLASRTLKNFRMVLAEMFRYAHQKRYVAENVMEEFTRGDVKQLEGRQGKNRQPAILSVEEARKLITTAFAHPELDLGAAVTLGMFCGIRTEELKKLTWDTVRMDDPEPFVVIGPEVAKKRRIRNVPIPANAMAWLGRWRRGKTVTRSDHVNDFQKRFQRLQKLAGFGKRTSKGAWESTWEANAMRHSFGSYDYARAGDAVATSRKLGHKADDTVLFAHYRALATKAQGEAYFGIAPTKGIK